MPANPRSSAAANLLAGAAAVDITPVDSQFLYGYPHVRRYSSGVHDRLFSSALYLNDGQNLAILMHIKLWN